MTLPDPKRQRPALDVSKITLRQCTALLKQIKGMPEAAPFLVPVDPVALRIPDYPTIVKSPMDLGTIDKKLTSSSYHDVESFIADVRLVFHNSYIYNKKDSPVGKATKVLDDRFETKLGELVTSSGAAPALSGGRAPTLAPIAVSGSAGPALVSTIKPIIKSLVAHARSAPFRKPVDMQMFPNYLETEGIKTPMDLSTVQQKLEEGRYTNVAEVKVDLDLIWNNCADSRWMRPPGTVRRPRPVAPLGGQAAPSHRRLSGSTEAFAAAS